MKNICILIIIVLLMGCNSKNNLIEKSKDETITNSFKIESVNTENLKNTNETMINNDFEQSGEKMGNIINTEESFIEPKDEDLVEIRKYIPNIKIDLKYATEDNFTGVIIYDNDIALLRYGTLKKLMKVQEKLNEQGYSLLILDAYRPTKAQFKLWSICPDPTYVANPNNGFSNHSRGNTIDVSIVKIDGSKIEMPSKFDEFSKLANRDYNDVSEEAKKNALLLENTMKENGFNAYFGEWWHFSDTDSYDVVN